jgi:hypothetical protein
MEQSDDARLSVISARLATLEAAQVDLVSAFHRLRTDLDNVSTEMKNFKLVAVHLDERTKALEAELTLLHQTHR